MPAGGLHRAYIAATFCREKLFAEAGMDLAAAPERVKLAVILVSRRRYLLGGEEGNVVVHDRIRTSRIFRNIRV